jgi:hypothetical protein
MKKALLFGLIASTLAVASGAVSAGVITTGSGVKYTATLTGGILDLTIDATGIKADLKKATQLDGIEFQMFNLTGVSLLSAPTSGWAYDFDPSAAKADSASFDAIVSNDLLLSSPMDFKFKFAGEAPGLDFTKLAVTTNWLINRSHSTDVVRALDVTIMQPIAMPAALPAPQPAPLPAAGPRESQVPEPASTALVLGGLGLLAISRRRFGRG